jgi:hypothetical protein
MTGAVSQVAVRFTLRGKTNKARRGALIDPRQSFEVMRMSRGRLAGIGAAICVVMLGADAAYAINRRIRVVNDSKHDIVELFAVNVGSGTAELDMLGDGDLPPGGAVILNFEDGSGYCRFRFRAIFRDGMALSRNSVNVCEVGTFRYTD